MSDLLVDVSVLERVHSALEDAAGNLAHLRKRLANASACDLGDRRIDRAAERFFERWGYGTRRLGEAADVVARQVDEALRVYAEADDELANVFRSEP